MSLVVQSGSKQYVLELGQKFLVDRLEAELSSTVELNLIHAYGENAGLKAVKATVLRHLKGEKIRVVKFKSKSNYHRQYGHRSYLTELQVEGGIVKPVKKAVKEEVNIEETKPEKKATKTVKPAEVKEKAVKVEKKAVVKKATTVKKAETSETK